jgi:hypothetical protein
MNKILVLIAALLSTAQVNAADSNPAGYFVTVFKAGANNSQTAVVGNQSNPHLAVLNCESGFQAEGVFSVTCVSDASAPFDHQGIIFQIGNMFNLQQGGQLTIKNDPSLTLSCVANDPNNNSAGAVCK